MEEDYADLLAEVSELAEDIISIGDISKELNISREKVMGLIGLLRKRGLNVIVANKKDDIYVLNNGDMLYCNDYVWRFNTNENNIIKFLVISDTRFGSIFAQPSILNELYRHAYDLGVRNVIHAGNITEGLYKMSNNMIETLIVRDTLQQAEYVVKNYPGIEGMTTHFITGKKDRTHLVANKIDIGKQIAEQRSDMNYIGTGRCRLFVDNIEMLLLSRSQRKTYTQSYRAQKMIDAMRSESKPQFLLYGGLLQSEKFAYRNVQVLSVPSICATTWEMEEKEYANVVGGWIFEITTDKKGNLLNFQSIDDIYYQTIKNDHETAKILRIGGR